MTAVEWLVSRLKIIEAIDVRDVQQAKEMEEKQKLDAYLRGIENLKQLLKDKQNDSSRMVN